MKKPEQPENSKNSVMIASRRASRREKVGGPMVCRLWSGWPVNICRALVTFLLLHGLAISANARSQRVEEQTFARLATAEVAFYGVAVDVQYQLSSDEIPHTFVTYQVLDVLSGDIGTEITLRFIGGPDGRGGIFQLADTPMFNIGDEDVLFVSGNGTSTCPLVDCARGRLRVWSEGIYNDNGVPLVAIEDGSGRAEDGAGRFNAKLRFRGQAEPELLTRTFPRPEFDGLLQNPEFSKIVDELLATGAELADLRALYEEQAPLLIELSAMSALANEGPGDLVAMTGASAARTLAGVNRTEVLDRSSVLETLRTHCSAFASSRLAVRASSLTVGQSFSSGLSLTEQLPSQAATDNRRNGVGR